MGRLVLPRGRRPVSVCVEGEMELASGIGTFAGMIGDPGYWLIVIIGLAAAVVAYLGVTGRLRP